jgi:hypothetical protein
MVVVLMANGAHGQAFRVERTDGELYFESRYENQLRERTRGEIDEDEWRLIEGIRYGGEGWVLHPAILSYHGGMGVEFGQDFFRPQGSDGTDRDRLRLNYDLRADVLPERAAPLFFGVSQTHTEVDVPLLPTRDIDAFRFGAGINFRELALGSFEIPSQLEFRHEDTDTTGGRFTTQRTLDELRLRMNNATQNSRSRLDYDIGSLENSSGGVARSADRQNLRVLSDRYFSNGTLGSRLMFTDNNDTRDVTSIGLAETLILRHRRSLTSNYNYAFNHLDSDGSNQDSHHGGAGITHQLFQSLTSSASANGSYSDLELGRIWSAQGTLGFNYTKAIPFGRFGLRLSPTYAYQDEDTEAGIQTILGESHVIPTTFVFSLDRPFVLDGTIVVRDASGLIEFIEGIDYEVFAVGGTAGSLIQLAEIRVIPGGDLDPAVSGISNVVVDYDVEAQPALAYSTRTITTGGSLSLFDHVYADLTYSDTMRDLRSGFANEFVLGDEERLLGAIQTTFEHHLTRLEYERTRSPFDPRDRWSLAHSMHFRPTPDTTLGVGAGYSRDKLHARDDIQRFGTDTSLVLDDEDRVSEAYSLTLDGTWWALSNLLLRLNLVGRQLNQEEQDTLAAGATLSATYRVGLLDFQIKGRLQWRESELDTGRFTRGGFSDDQTEERYSAVIFRVSRRF